MNQLPIARPEAVEKAKHLVGDPAYPPRETIQRIAALLAIKDTGNNNQD